MNFRLNVIKVGEFAKILGSFYRDALILAVFVGLQSCIHLEHVRSFSVVEQPTFRSTHVNGNCKTERINRNRTRVTL